VSVQAEILNLFRRLRADLGLTLVLVTHNLAVVANLCDRLAVMQHGQIVESLTAETLRQGQAAERYTQTLLAASRGYDRATLAAAEALERGG
jgi:peptide/nickel transport system ATP-binding protein